MNQNKHVYAIYCRPEVDNDVISGHSVKILEGYAVVNFEADRSSFRYFPKSSFCDGEVGEDRGSGMNAICSRPEVRK